MWGAACALEDLLTVAPLERKGSLQQQLDLLQVNVLPSRLLWRLLPRRRIIHWIGRQRAWICRLRSRVDSKRPALRASSPQLVLVTARVARALSYKRRIKPPSSSLDFYQRSVYSRWPLPWAIQRSIPNVGIAASSGWTSGPITIAHRLTSTLDDKATDSRKHTIEAATPGCTTPDLQRKDLPGHHLKRYSKPTSGCLVPFLFGFSVMSNSWPRLVFEHLSDT